MAALKDKLNKYEAYDELFRTPGMKLIFDVKSLTGFIRGSTSDFKIGVAHDCVKRWMGYINHKGEEVPALKRDFKKMVVSPVEDNCSASKWEDQLIKSYKSHPMCLNIARGGAVVSGEELTEPYFVYVCFK